MWWKTFEAPERPEDAYNGPYSPKAFATKFNIEIAFLESQCW